MIISYTNNQNPKRLEIIDVFIKTQSIDLGNHESIFENERSIDISIFGPDFHALNRHQQQRIINITRIDWSRSLERQLYINKYMKRYVTLLANWCKSKEISNHSNVVRFVDIGCGPGTASVGFLNYIYFHKESFPNLRRIEILLIDHKTEACEAAKNIIRDFTNFWFLQTCLPHIRNLQITVNSQCVSDDLDNIIITSEVDYFMCCNVICELNTTALDNLFRLLNATSATFFVSDCVLWRKFNAFSSRFGQYPPNRMVFQLTGETDITLNWFDRILPPIRRARDDSESYLDDPPF